jgi:hypothetical protein
MNHDLIKFIVVPGAVIWVWICWIAGRAANAREEARITGRRSGVGEYWLIPLFLLRLTVVYLLVLLGMILISDWAGFKQ